MPNYSILSLHIYQACRSRIVNSIWNFSSSVNDAKQVDKEEKPTKLAFNIPKHIFGANLNIKKN
jgi:hypothetical protein